MTRHPMLLTALLATGLVLAGCSYTPARIQSEPLVIIDDERGHGHRDDHRRGGFCPPGLEMQGRC
ncbi:hypothetical protein [Halomonas cerina]|uniref:Starvation-inducible outer membrane lipoprotein n=1 Tax=Halomonas cerina TaxID=447424 RepID=A0A839VAG1_9GAMM|nr:hypothetical protein [Halomonas cerina]MBB3192131.1 starvation-inducible outer membrane lipoprotein [Halomonas cerina]